MEVVGEQLYSMISQVHPELAPKLTGMLLQLGAEECQNCLRCQETLALRMDEAIKILDGAGGHRTAPVKKPQPQETHGTERRIDPEDGQARTFEELRAMCKGKYTLKEIEDYWKTCSPASAAGATSSANGGYAKAPGQPAQSSRGGDRAVHDDSAAPPAKMPQADVREDRGDLADVAGGAGDELVPGLAVWLGELSLSGYEKAAIEWAEEQGACELEEIVENLEDFAADLGLRPLEKKRLLQGAEAAVAVAAEAVAQAAEEAVEEVAPQEPAKEQVIKPDPKAAEVKKEAPSRAGGEDYPALSANGAGKKGRRR